MITPKLYNLRDKKTMRIVDSGLTCKIRKNSNIFFTILFAGKNCLIFLRNLRIFKSQLAASQTDFRNHCCLCRYCQSRYHRNRRFLIRFHCR